MSELKPLSLGLRNEINKYFKAENSRSADYCFGNFYLWDKRFEQYVTVIGSRLVTLLTRGGETWFAFPVGSGDLSPALDFMKDFCREKGIPLKICGICNEQLPLPDGEFEIFPDRAFSDYIYDIDKLSSFSGKQLHGKKNFCNRFEKEHDWRFEPINAGNISCCEDMLSLWHSAEDKRLDTNIVYENDALRRAFESFEVLGLEGGILFADGKAVGFSIGELIGGDTFCVHFEKAFTDIPGAYPMVCREMSKMIKAKHHNIRYVNREDDMGLESLRKSKLSYKPEFILEKHIAIWQERKLQ